MAEMKIILNHKNMSLDIPIAKQYYPIKYMCDYFKMAQSLVLHIKAHVIVNHYENKCLEKSQFPQGRKKTCSTN